MSDTPETDALVESINKNEARHEHDFCEMTWLARRLERERDEALAKHPDGTCLDCGGPLQAVRPGKHQCNNCDNFRHVQTMLEETAKLAATLKRERDEARKQLENHIASTIHSCHDECQRPLCVLRRERDEARQQLAELGESRPQDNPTRHGGRVEKTEQDFQP